MDDPSFERVTGALLIVAICGAAAYLWHHRRTTADADPDATPTISTTGQSAASESGKPAFPAECRMALHAVVPGTVAAGELITLQGKWGPRADYKLPVINLGGSHPLEVEAWSDGEIQARVPIELNAGVYRAGVYCAPYGSATTMWSSGFADVRVLAPSVERAQ